MNDNDNKLFEKGYHIVGINRGRVAKLYYELYGDKNATNKVLLVMGFMQTSKAWKFQLDYLKKQPNLQICIYDNRGLGNSNSFSISTKELALDAIDLINCLKWKNVHFVGASLGGSVCILLCNLIEKELIKSILISAPHMGMFSPFIQPGFFLYFKSLFEFNKKEKFKLLSESLFSNDYLNEFSISNPKLTKLDAMIERAIAKNEVPKLSINSLFGNIYSVLSFKITNSLIYNIKKRNSNNELNICFINGINDKLVNLNYSKKFISKINNNNNNNINYNLLKSGHCINLEKIDKFNSIMYNHIISNNNRSYTTTTTIFKHNYNLKNILKFFK